MAADERATITIDVDVKNLNRLQQVTAALEEMGIASEVNAAKFSQLTGAMTGHSKASNNASKSSQRLYEKISLLDKVSMQFTKQARKLMLGVMAMSAEFAVSALALASVNAAFVIGKVLVKGYQLAMQGLAAGLAAVGVAAIGAAAAFSEFQTAQFAFRYNSDSTTTAMDKSSLALRGLYKDTQLNIYGMKALSAAFAGVSKNAKFTGESQKMLRGFSDFIASSGDPEKAMQAAANAVGLIQKAQTGINKNSKNMSTEALNAIKQINPALADLAKKGGAGFGNKEKFIEALLDGSLAEKAGLAGAADNVAGTLFAQFKSYLSSAFVELSDVGKRVLEPIKEAMNSIFKGLIRTFRRVSSDLVDFGNGPFLQTLVTAAEKIEDFSVMLFRKYLPMTEGFGKRLSALFFQLKSYFNQVKTSLDSMRDGGSIVIKTFGEPILEIFKQIGSSARNIADLATNNKDSFLKFGEALKGIVVGFFDLSRVFKEAFTGALPVITIVLNALAKIATTISKIFGAFTGPGNPIASALGMFAMGSMAIKGTRAAQRKNRYNKKNPGIQGYQEINPLEFAARGLPMPSMASGAATAAGGGTSLSGAMNLAGSAASTALTTGLAPGISSVSSASSSAASALGALATAATGASLRGGLGGGRVNASGYAVSRPQRKAGQTDAQYRADVSQWIKQQKGGHAAYDSGRPSMTRGEFLRQKYGSSGEIDRRPISERGMTQGNRTQTQINARYRAESESLSSAIQKRQNKLQGMARAKEIAIQRKADALKARGDLYEKAFYPTPTGNLPGTTPTRMDKIKGGISRWTSGQTPRRLEAQLDARTAKIPGFFNNLYFGGGGGVTGAMPAGGGTTGASAGGGGGIVNPGPGKLKDIGLKGKLDYYGGKAMFGQGYQGGTFKSEAKNLVTGANFRKRYQMSLANQQAALKEMYPDAAAAGVPLKGSRMQALKAAGKANFSGVGIAGTMAASALAGRYGSDEAQGALQAGAGLMSINPLLGIGVAGLGTAMSSKTKMGGVMSGAAGGAAMGAMLGPLGAAVGGILGAGFGFFAAKRNQAKMVKNAVKQIGDRQLAGIAAKAVEGGLLGTTALARKKMTETGALADAFRGAKTEAERKKVLEQYSTGPNAVLTGNAASLAVGDNYADTQKQLDANVKNQKALNPLMDNFDKVMKSLKGTTSMTAAEIFDLAMNKNVNLYDSTLNLSDITSKLGIGMVKTAKQMSDALKDIRIGAQGVYEEYKRGKDLKDSLQGAGNTLRSGDNSAQAMADYLNKFGDYLDYKNPNSPVSNIVATIKAFGSGSAFGTGLYFQKNGVLGNVTQSTENQKLGAEYTRQVTTGTSQELANQLSSQLLANKVQGVDPDLMRRQIAGRTLNLMNAVNAGNAAGATQEQKSAAVAAEGMLKELERLATNPTALQGMTAGESSAALNKALYGSATGPFGKGGLALENIVEKSIEVTVDQKAIQDAFLNAVNTGFAQSKDAPQWWNEAPNWWDNVKWDAKANSFVVGDTRSSRRGRIGDTGAPKALGATMSAHNSMNSMLTGKRSVTSSFRTNNLGSPSSDHAAGRAYDLSGQNLGQYASLAKASGGFAEFHGAASTRHLHVVPALGRSGDTATPVGSIMSPSGTTYNGGDISITIVESKDARATAKEVANEIIAMQKNERRRI